MFKQESNSKFTFYKEDGIKVPSSMEFVDCTFEPRECNTIESQSYLIAQFVDMIKFRKTGDNQNRITPTQIRTMFNKSGGSDEMHPTLSKEMEYCAKNFLGRKTSDVVYMKDIKSIKRYLHKYHALILETYLTDKLTTQNGTFKITKSGTKIAATEGLTKGFLALGYDSDYILVQNSLGRKYGQLGFVRISWDVVKNVIVKAAAIENIFN